MKKNFVVATAAFAFLAAPALADDARTPPPSEPYYAPQAATCDTVNLKIYFEPGEAGLTPFARDAVREAREQLSGCAVLKIDATAVTADADSDADKLTLTEARRTVVMSELKAHGIRAADTQFQTKINVDAADSVMARKANLTLEAEPAIVG